MGFGTQGFAFGRFPPQSARHSLRQCLPARVGLSGVCASLSSNFVSFISAFLMAHRRESTASKAQGKCPAKPSQSDQSEARRKARYDTALFASVEYYQRYKQKFA